MAFAFGSPSTILSNRRIAQIALEKSLKLNAPIYTQIDVCIKDNILVDYIIQRDSYPPTTLQIAKGAVQWAKESGFSELWIVAAMPHLWRCKRDLAGVIRETKAEIKIKICEKNKKMRYSYWFCQDSIQLHTQSQENWEAIEKIIKRIPFCFYKYLAG